MIHDVWAGYNPHSPIARIWTLRRNPSGEFMGEGRFSTSSVAERIVEVTIDATKAAQFLDAVAKAIVASGDYEPLMTHTDDFPHIEVAFHVPVPDTWRRQGLALLFTESQGQFHSPWGACIGGERRVIPGAEVGRALSKLDKPLKCGTLDKLMAEADRR